MGSALTDACALMMVTATMAAPDLNTFSVTLVRTVLIVAPANFQLRLYYYDYATVISISVSYRKFTSRYGLA